MADIKHLKKRQEFLDTQLKGQSWVSSSLVVQYYPHQRNDDIRVGYTVTKKVSKLAVDRNRIKRRLRAAVSEIVPKHGNNGADYVVIGKKDALTADFKELKRNLKWCLKRVHDKNA